MKPMEAFYNLLGRIILSDRWRNRGPGEVVKSMSPEAREALTNLKSDQLAADQVHPDDWEMMGPDYHTPNPSKLQLLEFEKKLGIKPPPRKKYGDYEGQ